MTGEGLHARALIQYAPAMLWDRRKRAPLVGGMIGCAAVILIGTVEVPAWLARYRASRVLGRVGRLQPGLTTVSEARAQLEPVKEYEDLNPTVRSQLRSGETSFTFYNVAEPVARLVNLLPASFAQHVTLPWTMFQVSLTYRDDRVSALHIVEMQQGFPGAPHPSAVSTTLLSQNLSQNRYSVPVDFNGYSENERTTGVLDEQGSKTGLSCCHVRVITLDERASEAQRANAVNFQLQCLSSWRRCKSDHEIVP